MKRVYALLFNLTLISTHSVAKNTKIETKNSHNKNGNTIHKKLNKKDDNFKLANYKIKDGDTLFTIARKHHTTVSQVELVNKLEKNEKLKIGRVLKVPTNTYTPTQHNSTNAKKKSSKQRYLTHTIVSGDTLLAIALNNDTSLVELEKLNKFSAKEKKLKLGEKILIPKTTKEKQSSLEKVAKVEKKSTSTKKSKKVAHKKKDFHIIKKGDTLYRIATQNDTTVAKIKKINNITKSTNLKLGQKILLKENRAIAKKSKAKKLRVVKKQLKNKKNTTPKIATVKIKNKKKIASLDDKTTRFTKRRVKSQARSEQKSIFDFLSFGGSSLKLSAAKKQLGKRYVWGAIGPRTFDCSGFTKYVCDKNGVCIPRRAIEQSKVGKKVASIKNLKAGDLIFFDTSHRRRGYVNHVGIYIGNNKFIHASSAKRKVVITSLKRPFYKSRFKWGRRIKS